MTQTRVFVTYLPAQSAPGRASLRPLGSLGASSATVIAGAIFAGGLVHALGGAGATTYRDARAVFGVAPDSGATRSREAVALLALASAELAHPVDLSSARLRTAPATSTQRPTKVAPRTAQALGAVASVASPQAVTGKRRDLEGFLDEQGYAMAPVDTASEGSSSLVESPGVFAPAPERAPREGGIAPNAEPTLQPLMPSQGKTQTFPRVMVDGVELGAVTMRGDNVHLGSLIGLLELKMPAEEFVRLKAAPAASSFVSIDVLREAGLEVTVEADGETVELAAR